MDAPHLAAFKTVTGNDGGDAAAMPVREAAGTTPATLVSASGGWGLMRAMTSRRTARSWGGPNIFLLFVVLLSGCGIVEPPATPTPTPDPVITASILVRERAALRADREWVEAVQANPASVERLGIKVSPDEAEQLDQAALPNAVESRRRLGLRHDEAWVRRVLADPRSVDWGGLPVTREEAARLEHAVTTAAEIMPVLNNYARDHRDEWSGVYRDDIGTMHVLVTGRPAEHEAAIRALFADPVQLQVDQVRWSERDLDALLTPIRKPDFERWLTRHDISLEGYGIRTRENRVGIEVTAGPESGDITRLIMEHLDGGDWLLVDVELREPTELLTERGSLVVTVVDAAGRSPSGGYVLISPDVSGAFPDDVFATNRCDVEPVRGGVCVWSDLGATGYTIEVWSPFGRALLGRGRVVIPPGGTGRVTIEIPAG